MNIEAYISSGIIETYVMGLTTHAETAEVEAYAKQYAEVRLAIEEARVVLEKFATTYSKTPPTELKEKIWDQLQNESSTKEDIIIIKPSINIPEKRSRSFTWLAAASVVLLAGSLLWNVTLQRKNKSLEETVVSINEKQTQLEDAIHQRDTLLTAYQQYSIMIADSNVRTVAMKGVGTHLNMQALVLWDKLSKEVYLSVNNLPQPPQGKQYQLWAIVDGKPVDMGVFNTALPLQKLKTTAAAEMFAVTLEKEGGSPVPTMEEMYVAGKI